MRSLMAMLLCSVAVLTAAQQPGTEKTATPPHNPKSAFAAGRFSGSFRSFFMATDNARHLSDYHALAAGGSLSYATAPFKGFSLGIGGMFHFNLASSDLEAKDSITGAVNRYEVGLFDVTQPGNKDDLDRLETFFLRYTFRRTAATLGRQMIQSPFINHQDGRMRPTVESGIWVESEALPHFKVEGGWLWRMSPRSTVAWYSVGESIGLYPKGLNPDGTASGYAENLESKGIGLMGVTRQIGKGAKVQVWNQFVENIYNTALAQADVIFPINTTHKGVFGIQAVRQDAAGEGGNPDASKAYFPKKGKSLVFSAQAGWQNARWQALAAYTRITDDGRFLSPREWGREPFYTFMPRERMEGSGDSHAATFRVALLDARKKWRIETAYGRYWLPDVKQAALNKYAFPAFDQLNVELRYTFGGFFDGLKAQFLYVYKGNKGAVYGNEKFVINKVDMGHYNLILNYYF